MPVDSHMGGTAPEGEKRLSLRMTRDTRGKVL